MEKKPLYIYDDTNNEVPYYIPASYVHVDSDSDTTLADFYSAYNSSTDSVINADTGRVEIGKSPIVVLDSMGATIDGHSHVLATGQYIYDPTPKKIRFIKNLDSAENRYYDVDQRVIYCNKENDKLYRFDGTDMIEVGNLDFVTPAVLDNRLSDYVPKLTNADNRIHPNYCRILPVESMGETLDNIGLEQGDPAWFTFDSTPYLDHTPGFWIDVDGNTPVLFDFYGHGYSVNTYTRYINRHTGRCYHWSGTGINFIEEPTPGSSIAPEALIPYIGRDGYWYVGDTNQGVLAQGPAGSVTIADNLETTNGDVALSAKQGYILKREFLRLIDCMRRDNIDSFVPNWNVEDTNKYSITATGTGFTISSSTGSTTDIDENTRNLQITITPENNYRILEVTAEMGGTHGDRVISIVDEGIEYKVNVTIVTGDIHIAVRTMYASPGAIPYTPGGNNPQQGTIDTNTESNTVDGNG